MSMLLDELKAFIEERIAENRKRLDSSHVATYEMAVAKIAAYNIVLTKIHNMEKHNGHNTKN